MANPVNTLCKLLAQVTDSEGRITIPHFYDRVEEVPEAERRMIARIPFDEARYKASIGVEELEEGGGSVYAPFAVGLLKTAERREQLRSALEEYRRDACLDMYRRRTEMM